MQARLIKNSYKDISAEGAAEMATANQRLNKGVKSLYDNFATWNKTL